MILTLIVLGIQRQCTFTIEVVVILQMLWGGAATMLLQHAEDDDDDDLASKVLDRMLGLNKVVIFLVSALFHLHLFFFRN